MATPFYFNVVIDYEDSRGNLTGDNDMIRFYNADVAAGMAHIGVAGAGNTFVFTRGPGRLRDIVCAMAAAASTTKGIQMMVNGLLRNQTFIVDAQVSAAIRPNIGLRLAGGSQIEFLVVA